MCRSRSGPRPGWGTASAPGCSGPGRAALADRRRRPARTSPLDLAGFGRLRSQAGWLTWTEGVDPGSDDFDDGLGGFNPFSKLASTAAQIVTDAWTAGWLSVWNAGLWVLRLVLSWMDAWLTPDLSAGGSRP